jgi:nucleotide-binding universal stress UspA family protein
MKPKILIPVDFTKTSFSAYVYGNQLAAEIKGEITLLHIVQGSFSSVDAFFIDNLEATTKVSMTRLKYFAKEYPKELGYELLPVKTKYELRYGVPGFTVTDYAADKKFDYIIAGTRDNHNIIEKVLGSTSKIMAKTTRVPIIFVHENTKYRKPERIVFAIDNQADFDECIDRFMHYNQYFKAKTTFIHIARDKPDLEQTKSAILKEIFDEKYPGFSFDIKSIQGSDVSQSIIDYCIFDKSDLLTVVHRKKGFFSDLFEKSVSFKTVEGIHLPILWLVETKP